MLSNLIDYVKKYRSEILYTVTVLLLCFLAFAVGYITANYQSQQSIQFIQTPK